MRYIGGMKSEKLYEHRTAGHLAPAKTARVLPGFSSKMLLALCLVLCGRQHACPAPGASLIIYDLSTGQEIKALAGHNRPTTAIAVSPDGTLALTASLTPELRLWSLGTGRQLRSLSPSPLPGAVGAGRSLQFVNGTNLALVGRYHAGVQLWNLESNTLVVAFKSPFLGTSTAQLSSDQKTVAATSGSEARVAVWGLADGARLADFSEEWIPGVPCVSLAREGKPRSWWEAETGDPCPESRPIPAVTVRGFMDQALLSPDGKTLITYGASITKGNSAWVHLWDIDGGKLLWHDQGLDLLMTASFEPRPTCAAIAFSPDSKTLALGMRGKGLWTYEVERGRLRQALETAPGSCSRLAFLPDGKRVLTWGDKTMRVWDLETARMLRAFTVPTVNCLAITPDGRFVLVGGDGEFRGL